MPKVYPNGVTATARRAGVSAEPSKPSAADDDRPVALTVWKKSLLLNYNGFTVFDSKGDLVFRVDNYIDGGKGEIVLMDASGKALLTIRRKRLSLPENWLVFDGETAVNPRYSVTKHVSFLNSKSILAYVTSSHGKTNNIHAGDGSSSPSSSNNNNMLYKIEGSYAKRCCTVYDDARRPVAEIKRKEAVGGRCFGVDVFRLIVRSPHEIDPPVAMALVILLDRMFGSARRPNFC